MIYIVGSGFLGSTLADYFSDRGYDMHVINRYDPYHKLNESDSIINCAASGYRRKVYDPKQTITDNLLLPILLRERSNGANMIHFGSWTEECAPKSDYSHSKALATSFLEGKAHVCMTCSVWGGPYESPEKFMGTFLKACATGAPYTITHPFRRRDFVHIDTFCPAIEALTKHKDYAKRYFATGRLRSFWSVYVELCNMTGKQFPNVQFVDDMSANYDWWVEKPEFEDTFRDDLAREWRKLCG
mgnify:CR=1 FL=1